MTGILMATAILMAACSRSHEVTSSLEIVVPNEFIGKWNITEFTDSGINKSSDLDGITLQFNAGWTLSAITSDSLVDGTWNIISDIGLDKVSMQFHTASRPYDLLTGTWFVYSQGTATISLSHSFSSHIQTLQITRQ